MNRPADRPPYVSTSWAPCAVPVRAAAHADGRRPGSTGRGGAGCDRWAARRSSGSSSRPSAAVRWWTPCGPRTQPALAVGAGVAVLTTACAAWRWRLVARTPGRRLPMPSAVAACYRAQFLNVTLPGGVLGDVGRGVHHGRRVDDVGRGLRTVAWERASGQVVLVVTTVSVLLVARPFAAPAVVVPAWVLVAGRGSGCRLRAERPGVDGRASAVGSRAWRRRTRGRCGARRHPAGSCSRRWPSWPGTWRRSSSRPGPSASRLAGRRAPAHSPAGAARRGGAAQPGGLGPT